MKNYLSILLLTFALSGFATTVAANAHVDIKNTSIEKNDSKIARIGNVELSRSGSALRVRGVVRTKKIVRGPIAGHLHIEALGKDDHILTTQVAGYKRPSTKSRRALFSKILNVNLELTKKVRVTHHRSRHHH